MHIELLPRDGPGSAPASPHRAAGPDRRLLAGTARPAGWRLVRASPHAGRGPRPRVPYLFVAGHEVEPEYADWLNRVLPQARITVWPGSGHFPHLAYPERFARCLAATAGWCGDADGGGGNPGRARAYGSFGAYLHLLCEQHPANGGVEEGKNDDGTRPVRRRTGCAPTSGELISPGDDGYDAARKVWNGAIDRHPALIARATSTGDVVTGGPFRPRARPAGQRPRRRALRGRLRRRRRGADDRPVRR